MSMVLLHMYCADSTQSKTNKAKVAEPFISKVLMKKAYGSSNEKILLSEGNYTTLVLIACIVDLINKKGGIRRNI